MEIERNQGHRLLVRAFALAVLFGAGLWLRTFQPLNLAAAVPWPWSSTAVVTLYFADGPFLFPVSRRMALEPELPHKAVEALLAGPPPGNRLKNPLPPGVALRSLRVDGSVAYVDLSGPMETIRSTPAGLTALVATITRLPGLSSAVVTVDGAPLVSPSTRPPLVYYSSPHGLVASPVAATGPRAALDTFLAGAPAPELTSLPSDARLIAYEFSAADGVLSLRFAYTPSVRTLAIQRPDRMRFLLLGLIATLTDFREVRAVHLDFGGQSRLGLGACSDLLRTPQPRPALLNDERLL